MNGGHFLVMGEGPGELGPLPPGGGKGAWQLTEGSLPALPQLVHQVLGAPVAARYSAKLNTRKVPHVQKNLLRKRGAKLSGHGKKVVWAMRLAKVEGYDGLVYVIDRGGIANRNVLEGMREGRSTVADECPLPCALGLAVETFDAWMIAHGDAIHAARGNPAKTHTEPESLDGKEGTGRHPKDVANTIFGTVGGSGLGARYASVAKHVNLELLERVCPQGFAPFAQEVRERIGPVLAKA